MSSADFCHSFSKMTTYVPNLSNHKSLMPILKPHAQAHLLSATDKCKICAEPAARHVHYGATTCFSCRAFFRRSLQNNTAAKYVCMRQSVCEMNIKTRKNCQYCRYMKCLAVGMNPSYVLSEDERKRRFRKRRNNSATEEEPANHIPVVMSVTVKSQVKDFEPKKFAEDVEMKKNELPKQEQIPKQSIIAPKEIPSLERYDSMSTEAKQCTSGANNMPQNKICFGQNPCVTSLPQKEENNFTRGSIIMRNNASTQKPMTPTLKTAFKDTEYKQSSRNESKMMKKKEPDLYFNEDNTTLLQFPTFYEFFGKRNSNVIKENFLSYKEGLLFKEIKEDPETEAESNSESEDEITQKIVLREEPIIIFTEDEKYQLSQLVKDHDMVYHSVNFGEVLIKEMLMCSMFGVAVSTSAAIQGYRLQVERITRISNSLKCFTNLSKVDQVTLLKENADLLVSLRGAIFFDKKKKGVDQVMSSMGMEDMETIKKTFKALIENHPMNHIDYKVFNSIQDPAAKKIEEHYSFLQGKVADAILDNITSILMTYIILFSSDFCSLENRRMVEKTQHHYLRILERCIYSASNRMEACTKMARMLNAVTCVREMADIKKSRAINHSATAQITA